MGNEMLMKISVYPNRTATHFSNPKILTEEAATELIKEMESFVHFPRSTMGFPGKIIVVGPQPRYLQTCCGQVKHRSSLDKKAVDMKLYTDTCNKYMMQKINLSDKVEFIRYSSVHGNDFDHNDLIDCVHLNKDAERVFAYWLMNTLERKHSPVVPPCKNPSFPALLNAVKIAAFGNSEMEQQICILCHNIQYLFCHTFSFETIIVHMSITFSSWCFEKILGINLE